jgi:hypothetical protein
MNRNPHPYGWANVNTLLTATSTANSTRRFGAKRSPGSRLSQQKMIAK